MYEGIVTKFVRKRYHLTTAEIAGAYAVFHGIYAYSAPIAWIVAGVAVVVAVEVHAR